jgi:hypothetical protein
MGRLSSSPAGLEEVIFAFRPGLLVCVVPGPPARSRPREAGTQATATVGWAREVGHGWLLPKHGAPTTPLLLELEPYCFAYSNLPGKDGLRQEALKPVKNTKCAARARLGLAELRTKVGVE